MAVQVKAKDVELQIAALKMEQEQAIKRELLERVQAAHLSRGELETSKEELQAQLAMYNSKFEELSLSITSTSGVLFPSPPRTYLPLASAQKKGGPGHTAVLGMSLLLPVCCSWPRLNVYFESLTTVLTA